jgi:hypothetical protein
MEVPVKKLALLLLALPLAACNDGSIYHANLMTTFYVPSSPDAPLPGQKQASPYRQKQFSEAQNNCEAQGIGPSIGPAGSKFWYCVNAYLWPRYKWMAAQNPDGSLHVILHRAEWQPGYFFPESHSSH